MLLHDHSEDKVKLNCQLSKQNQLCTHPSDQLQESLVKHSSHQLCNSMKDLYLLSLPTFLFIFPVCFLSCQKTLTGLLMWFFILLTSNIVCFSGALNQRRKRRSGSQKAKLPRDLGCQRKMRQKLKKLLLHGQLWPGKRSRRQQ